MSWEGSSKQMFLDPHPGLVTLLQEESAKTIMKSPSNRILVMDGAMGTLIAQKDH
jgi:hypothetical protein